MNGRTPTKEDKEWFTAICEYGCIVCRNEFQIFSPCSPHHIDGRTKEGCHKKTIGLCGAHHQGGEDNGVYTSRHPFKASFERRYGTEAELLKQLQEIIKGNA